MLDLQHRWVAALISADDAALDAILIDTYVDTDESGSRTDKAGILAALQTGDLKLASITLLETHVHRYGDAAVLTGASAQVGAFRGQPIARGYFSPQPWSCKTGSGERLRHTEPPCPVDMRGWSARCGKGRLMNLKEAAAVAKQEINDLIAPDTPQEVRSVLSVRNR